MDEEGEEWKHFKDTGDEWNQPKAQSPKMFIHVIALRHMVIETPAMAYRTDIEAICPPHWQFQ